MYMNDRMETMEKIHLIGLLLLGCVKPRKRRQNSDVNKQKRLHTFVKVSSVSFTDFIKQFI